MEQRTAKINQQAEELRSQTEELKTQTEHLQEKNNLLENKNAEINKQQTELLEKEKRLEELNATKDKFFSIIAHDLRNPFSAILIFSELLANKVDSFSMDDIREIGESMYNSSKEAHTFLENLLQWSQIQTGKIKPEYQKVNLTDLIYEVKSLCDAMVKAKNIETAFDLGFKDEIWIDKEMIKTAIRNLYINAIKFTFPDGKIMVKTQRVDNQVMVVISDTGTGIAPEHIDKLFKIDNKLTKVGTIKEKGTVLGLLLCKEFIEVHGGKIWVESELGKGRVFKFAISLDYNQEA